MGEASVWDTLGHAYRHVDAHQAVDCYRQAIARYRDLGDRMNEGFTLRRLGAALAAAGEAEAARHAWREALWSTPCAPTTTRTRIGSPRCSEC